MKPGQSIIFNYELFGEFNYYAEFNQERYGHVNSNVFNDLTLTSPIDFSAYSDIILVSIESQLLDSRYETLELEYRTDASIITGGNNDYLLNLNHPNVFRHDSLYSYEVIKKYGEGGDSFYSEGWQKYRHPKTDDYPGGYHLSNSNNPYLNSSNEYFRKAPENTENNYLEFNHSFLESPRILDHNDMFPGDLYQLRTTITRPNSASLTEGNGTIDIAVVTGGKNDQNFGQLDGSTPEITATDYKDTRGTEIFSTFNMALKWQMGIGQNEMQTSNMFVMPNYPTFFEGLNIQVGPGNADVDYTFPRSAFGPSINTIETYHHKSLDLRTKSASHLPHSFGIGYPWSMMMPVYKEMQSPSSGNLGGPLNLEDCFTKWWGPANSSSNVPTKFNTTKLKSVELLRYVKNPYMLRAVKKYRVNGEYSTSPHVGSSDGIKLIAQKLLTYSFEDISKMDNETAGGSATASVMQRRIILLSEVSDVPLTQDLIAPSYTLSSPDQVPTTFLTYSLTDPLDLNITDPIGGAPNGQSVSPFVGHRHYILTDYVDHLGGITKVEYYPMNDAPTRLQINSSWGENCDFEQSYDAGTGRSYTIFPAVKYLCKNDENNFVAGGYTGNSYNDLGQLKRWDYIYDLSAKIGNPQDLNIPDDHFRSKRFNRREFAFGKVKVIEPKLASGERNYTEYEYFGNQDTVLTEEEYLYYGKLKKTRSFDASNRLHSETIYEYDHTLAFENGWERPNLQREQMAFDSRVARNYEYEDYYKNDELSFTHTVTEIVDTTYSYLYDTTYVVSVSDTISTSPITILTDTVRVSNLPVSPYTLIEQKVDTIPVISGFVTQTDTNHVFTGDQAKLAAVTNPISGLGESKEKPKLMEYYFYNELLALNEPFRLNSYFIKKSSETNRVYEDGRQKGLTSSGSGGLPVTPPDLVSPANGKYDLTNPAGVSTPGDVGYYNDIILKRDTSLANLMNVSPLSDSVLMYIAETSNLSFSTKASILAYQGGLSNKVWKKIIDRQDAYLPADFKKIINAQPYITDPIYLYLLGRLDNRMDASIYEKIFTKNSYLTDQVVSQMCITRLSFPGESFTNSLKGQPQRTEAILTKIINSSHLTSTQLPIVLEHQHLSEGLFSLILSDSKYLYGDIAALIEKTPTYPTDDILGIIFGGDNVPDVASATQIAHAADRHLGQDIINHIFANYSRDDAKDILNLPLSKYEGYNNYCSNSTVENRIYIETKTEYEYYEADYTGTAQGVAYEVLMGFRPSAEEPKNTDHLLGTNIDELRLKHEPSWQLFSTKTSSIHNPGMYNREEYFYLYDLQNRYDRYWFNYDAQKAYTGVVNQGTDNEDTLGIFNGWDSSFGSELPKFDGMERTRKYGNRVIAFQKSTISKNTEDIQPLVRSEYYHYDKRWNYDDSTNHVEIIEYDGQTNYDPNNVDPPNTGGQIVGPCPTGTGCAECSLISVKPNEQVEDFVPNGYCAWSIPGEINNYYLCPSGYFDWSTIFPGAYILHCNTGTTVESSINKFLPLGDYLRRALLLRSVTVQVDTLQTQNSAFNQGKFDSKNSYVADFRMDGPGVDDEYGYDYPYSMLFPYDALTVRKVLGYNRYFQVELEENQVGLQTKYYYDTVANYDYQDTTCAVPSLSYLTNYSAIKNTNIGVPTKVTVGYGLPDSMSTHFTFNDAGQIVEMTDPAGIDSYFTFDSLWRLTSTKQENRLLSETEYHQWMHNDNLTFNERTAENYVLTKTYNGNTAVLPQYNYQLTKAFLDPLGRNQNTVSAYYDNTGTMHQIHKGSVEYDNWGRVNRAYKNFTAMGTTINPLVDISQPSAETLHENTPKSRALRASNYGVALSDQKVVKNLYHITDAAYMACELKILSSELQELIGSGTIQQFRFYRTELLDQDDKRTIEYSNAFGQKIATLKYSNFNEKIVTLFYYDSYGNLDKVVNPEKQASEYNYNTLGQLVIESTVDAGKKHYMYNKQGLVSVIQDEQGRQHMENGESKPFYRLFKYDLFGRLTQVGRKESAFNYWASNTYGPLIYQNTNVVANDTDDTSSDPAENHFVYTFSNASTQDWLTSFETWVPFGVGYSWHKVDVFDKLDSLFQTGVPHLNIDKLEKETFYNGAGQVERTYSYDNDGMKIQRIDYNYDSYGNVSNQVIRFNADQDVDVATNNKVSTITYPRYNYHNLPIEQQVDVDNDSSPDMFFYMLYDGLNRLKEVHASYSAQNNIAFGARSLVVDYSYDDANGLITQKRHYMNQGNAEVVNEINYLYDVRDRLTNIKSGQMTQGVADMMNYDLFYDGQAPQYYGASGLENVDFDNNYNGNINGAMMKYNFSPTLYTQSPTIFDKPTLYGYTYDNLNRMTSADATIEDVLVTTGTPQDLVDSYRIGDVSLQYDKIGNIESLLRVLKGGDPSMVMELEHYNYTYQGSTNRLSSVAGLSGTTSRTYTYDPNGNLLTDPHRKVDATQYGRAAYAYRIEDWNGATLESSTDYLYSIDDARIYSKITDQAGTVETYYLRDVFGKTIALEKKEGQPGEWEYYVHGSEREMRINAPANNSDALIENNDATYFVYDHLGNTRITFEVDTIISNIAQIAVRSVVDYYPYGKVLREYHNGGKERYLTTQHERDENTGLDYRGARYYDSDVARFLSLDPLAAKYPSWSDYNYVLGNPLIFIDPDGREAKSNVSGWDSEGHQQLAEAFGTVQLKYKEVEDEGEDEKTKQAPKSSTRQVKLKSIIDNSNVLLGIGSSILSYKISSFRLTNGSYNGNVFSPKIYTSGWKGGSIAKIKTYQFSRIGRFIGRTSFFGGLALDTYGLYTYYKYGANDPLAVHPVKFGVNTSIGIYGLAGGLGGAVFAPIYFGFEAFYPGGMQQALIDKGDRDQEVTNILRSQGNDSKIFNSFNLSDHGGNFKQ